MGFFTLSLDVWLVHFCHWLIHITSETEGDFNDELKGGVVFRSFTPISVCVDKRVKVFIYKSRL